AKVVRGHERAHVAFLRKVLGPAAGPTPTFHFGDATRDAQRFGAAAHDLENVGVAAYNGQGAELTAGALTQAAEIVSVEARDAPGTAARRPAGRRDGRWPASRWYGIGRGAPDAQRHRDPALRPGARVSAGRALHRGRAARRGQAEDTRFLARGGCPRARAR